MYIYDIVFQIKMTTATIMEPTGESDTPVKFTAGLLLGINFDAEIYNLEDVANVRIQVILIPILSDICLMFDTFPFVVLGHISRPASTLNISEIAGFQEVR